ncbi:MAG: restriction endonuclease subunit S [Fuerstiella sp.]
MSEKGWEEVALGNVCDFQNGFAFKSKTFQPSGEPVLRISNIQDGTIETRKIVFIDRSDYDKDLTQYEVEPGALLIAMSGGTTGKIGVNDTQTTFLLNQRVGKFIPRLNLDKQFLAYFLETKVEENLRISAGAAQPNLSTEQIKSFSIPFPEVAEQKRIVSILDEAFSAIAKAKENAEKNLLSARELFESYLNRVFTQQGPGWERFTLLDLLDKEWITSHLDGNHGGDYPRKAEFVSEGVPYISANCLRNGEIDMSRAKYLTPERAGKLRKGIAQDRDVLFAHNATVGPVTILRTDEPKIILGTSLTYYRCDEQHILPEYLSHYMRARPFTAQYKAVMRQSTRNQVPITKQRTFEHIIPPIEEQRRIVPTLDSLYEAGEQYIAIYTQKLANLDELKQSLLQKAFTGQLTDDQLISVP